MLDGALDIPDWLGSNYLTNYDSSLFTDVVFEHQVNILEDIVKGRGLFSGRTAPPSKVILGGYSFGGGTNQRLANTEWATIAPNVPIAGTAYIDAVNLGLAQLGDGVGTRPSHDGKHLHIWQENNIPINVLSGGMPAHGKGLGNKLAENSDGMSAEYVSADGKLREIKVLNTNHVLIDDEEQPFDATQIVEDYIQDLLQ